MLASDYTLFSLSQLLFLPFFPCSTILLVFSFFTVKNVFFLCWFQVLIVGVSIQVSTGKIIVCCVPISHCMFFFFYYRDCDKMPFQNLAQKISVRFCVLSFHSLHSTYCTYVCQHCPFSSPHIAWGAQSTCIVFQLFKCYDHVNSGCLIKLYVNACSFIYFYLFEFQV